MIRKKDIKSYLLLSSSSILKILKFSPRIYFLPSIIIYPTNICNYNCVMCGGIGNSKTEKNKERMDFSLMNKIINDCSKLLFKPILHFSGLGEPLVYPEIKRVMQLCKGKKLKWSLTTNGYLLEKYVEDLISNDCYGVNISIHGTTSEHDKITEVNGSFEKAVSGIKKIDEVKKTSKKDRPLIAINCVFNNNNVQNLKEILSALLKLPINSITFQHLIFSGNDLKAKEDFLIMENDKLNKLIEFIDFVENKKFPIRVNIFPKIKRRDIIGYYTDKDYKFNETCILPWLTVRIYPNGDIKLCNYCFFGNLRNDSLKSMINREQALKFRGLIRKRKLRMPECFRCCHRHYY